MVAVLFLDLLAGLPEEQVGADGGAEDRHQGRGVGRVPLDFGHDQGRQGPAPGHAGDHDHGHVAEQRQGRPLQDRGVARVVEEDFHQHAEHPELQCIEGAIAAGEE